MSDMVRYSIIEAKNKREMVLLKGLPCTWGKCAFCDYTEDNSVNKEEMIAFNREVLRHVTGKYQSLEVINSGSVFELPEQTRSDIRELVREKGIQRLTFESYWRYRERLNEIREYYGIPVTFKCGIETFDEDFRNRVLKKGFVTKGPEEIARYFSNICIMVGIQGQTKEMIRYDMDCLLKYFEKGCINVFVENSTAVKPDTELIEWFRKEYSHLEQYPNIEVLWNNTDLGVGEVLL